MAAFLKPRLPITKVPVSIVYRKDRVTPVGVAAVPDEAQYDAFNATYGTKVETVGGWDQMVAQIVAAPADNPPFDLTIADEYTTSAGLAGVTPSINSDAWRPVLGR